MIRTYLAQAVYWRARTGSDENGQPVFAAAVTVKGRWVGKRRLVRAQNGEQMTSEATVILPASAEVAPGDHLSQDGTTYVEIITVSAPPGLGGRVAQRLAYV
jgi:hypothetical protein